MMKNTQYTTQPRRFVQSMLTAIVFGLALFQGAHADQHKTKALTIDPVIGQAVFTNPEFAAQVLVAAIANLDTGKLKALFGEDAERLLPASKIKQTTIDGFVQGFTETHTFLAEGTRQYVLEVGVNGWTFPVPIALAKQGWYFDSAEGVERVRIRRIGKNELAVMQASLAYYDAQLEYAAQDRDGDGVLEYAQKFLSSDGMQDGLYWEMPLDSAPSPLGPLFSKESPEEAYFGYRYRILTSQGEYAGEGSLNYLEDENMTRGFALLASPADYGDTGVMTFMVNQEGLIYSVDLGVDTAEIVKTINRYDPGPDWAQEGYVLP